MCGCVGDGDDGGEGAAEVNHLEKADVHALQSHRFASEAKDHVWELATSCLMAQVKDALGETAEAILLYDRAHQEAEAVGDTISRAAISNARAALKEREDEEGADNAVAIAEAAAKDAATMDTTPVAEE